MVQLRERRTALLLYSVLLVLPTAVLGGLQWHQLAREHDEELGSVGENAKDTARRLANALRYRLHLLLESEHRRPFFEYAECFSESFTASPLKVEPRPPGVIGWFSYDPTFANYNRLHGKESGLEVLWGSQPPRDPDAAQLVAAAERFIQGSRAEAALFRPMRVEQMEEPRSFPLDVVAVNRGYREYRTCLEKCLPALRNRTVPITLSRFHLQLYRDEDGRPWVVASREVRLDQGIESLVPDLPKEAECIRTPLQWGVSLVQGFFIDPDWLFDELPRDLGQSVLGPDERLVPADDIGKPAGEEEVRARIRPVRELGLATRSDEDEDLGMIAISIDRAALRERFRDTKVRFLAVAAMLSLSLATGMVLLLRSVTRELDQARRAENFVASVTHELRTPLSAIKLHGEMLLEGWVSDDKKREDYYRRIVRETKRLSTLVERVLEKSRISQGPRPPAPGDLNALVGMVADDLRRMDGDEGADLEFELAPDLPNVMLSREAVASMLANLVENARKYAPFDPNDPASEPVRVSTRLLDGRVVLEVADRGPGVPPPERSRIFDAFYRVGDESTRTTKGTGLGLHIVALHAAAIGARCSVHDNPGGGALFRITFRTASRA